MEKLHSYEKYSTRSGLKTSDNGIGKLKTIFKTYKNLGIPSTARLAREIESGKMKRGLVRRYQTNSKTNRNFEVNVNATLTSPSDQHSSCTAMIRLLQLVNVPGTCTSFD